MNKLPRWQLILTPVIIATLFLQLFHSNTSSPPEPLALNPLEGASLFLFHYFCLMIILAGGIFQSITQHQPLGETLALSPDKNTKLSHIFFKGMGLGFLLIGVVIVVYSILTPLYRFFNIQEVPHLLFIIFEQSSISTRIIFFLMATTLVPFAEELLFRFLLFRFLDSFLPFSLASLLTSLFFGLAHYPLLTMLIPLSILGIILQYSFVKTQTLLIPIIAHITYNTTIFILYLIIR